MRAPRTTGREQDTRWEGGREDERPEEREGEVRREEGGREKGASFDLNQIDVLKT